MEKLILSVTEDINDDEEHDEPIADEYSQGSETYRSMINE